MDSFQIEPPRPLAPLYQPGAHFEISATGLIEWYQSPSFKVVADFYRGYPSRSLFNDYGRALLHHLIVMQRPERVLEIGTMYAGTTEVLARGLWEAGHGHVDTIDPYGAERCPPLIAELPADLRERISFFPTSSAMHFNEAIERRWAYDLVLIDGLHELEYVSFDLECAARVMRPGGLVVLDNIEQVGPRFATKHFLQRNPDWLDVAGVVGLMDRTAPLAEPTPSFPETKNYLLQAPPYYVITEVPRSFGNVRSEGGDIEAVEFELAAPAEGMLHIQAYVRTWGKTMVHSEELGHSQATPIKAEKGERLKVALSSPVRTEVDDDEVLDRRIEISLAFVGDGRLALVDVPSPFPARYKHY
jgi:predicted O-methyltransferase YrrM